MKTSEVETIEAPIKAIQEKAAKAQKLTPAEEKAVMETVDSSPETPTDESGKKDTAPVKEPSKEPAPDKKADESVPKGTDENSRKLLEAELEKVPGTEDLTKFNQKELALFHRMRKEQRRNQRLQGENDLLKFRELQRLANKEEKPEEPAKKESTEEVDDFQKELDALQDDDILTAGQAKKMMAAFKKDQAKAKPAEQDQKPAVTPQTARIFNVEARQFLQSKGINDFDEVVVYASALLDGDKDAEEEVKAAVRQNGNPSLAAYYLVKAHPKWPEIEKQLKGEKDEPAKDLRAEKIKENEKKPVTTGGAGGSGGEETDLTLRDVTNQWESLTPKQRSYYWDKYKME